MSTFSLRTLMVATLGVCILCVLFTTSGWNPTVAHLLLVLAFGGPAGSWAFDCKPTHDAAIAGTCLGAVGGTLCLSAIVLAIDWMRLLG